MKENLKKVLRNKEVFKDLLLYAVVGGLATLVEWGVFYLLNQLGGIQYIVATAIAFVFSTFANWGFGRLLIFKDVGQNLKKEISQIYLVSIIGLLANILIMFVAIDLLHWDEMFSKIIATGLVFMWNFLIRRMVIYNNTKLL